MNNISSLKRDVSNIEQTKLFYIEKLSLKNFRNHKNLNLYLNNSSVLLYGENGCGKTNVLEAISLLNQGKGLRRSNLDNYLYQDNLNKNECNVWGINADFVSPSGKNNLGTGLKRNSSNISRIAKVNLENVPLSSLGNILNISWITPQMCILFLTGMSERRRFIDRLTSSIDNLHLNRVYKYEKLARQRNKILTQQINDKIWLDTIESQISELSISITARRLDLVDTLDNLYKNELKNNSLTDYFPSAGIIIEGKIENFLLNSSALEAEDYIKMELKKSRFNQDSFNFGPSYSSVKIYNRISRKNSDFLSTGEQKLLLISIILSHARMLNNKFNIAPILLLDDIVEHLDKKHKKALFEEISKHYGQSWFTSTSRDAFIEFPNLINKINLSQIKDCFNGNYYIRNGDT